MLFVFYPFPGVQVLFPAHLGYLTDHPYASLQETADACELSLGGVKKIVTKLREMTIIERKGAKNNPVWVIH